MALNYGLMVQPKWNLVDLTGKQLGAGYIRTFNSITRAPVVFYKDIGGVVAWPTQIPIDANGMVGPLYGLSDTLDPTFSYYIEVYDVNNVLQFTSDTLFPSGSAGGGGSVNTTIDLDNIIINSIFHQNMGTLTSPFTTATIAPGLHSGFAGTSLPDIQFIKNNASAIDSISFPSFTLGSTSLTGDVTPPQYFRYTCTNSPLGETTKYLKIPIIKNVQNFSNVQVTSSVWARNIAGDNTLTMSVLQNFGDGGSPSAPVTTFLQTITLTGTWTRYTFTFTIPSVTGKTLGSCGTDALYLLFGFPLGTPTTIDLIKPELYLGASAATSSFTTLDDIEATTAAQRTGDIRVSTRPTSSVFGWVSMNDGTIGSAASGATTRANIDTFPLFEMLWNNVLDAYAPVSGGRGVSAIADFSANKTIALTKQLGRDIASVGIPSSGGTATNWALGQTFGEEQHILSVPELAAHSHTPSQASTRYLGPTGIVGTLNAGNEVGDYTFQDTGVTGSNTPHNTIHPRVHYNVFMKL